MRATLDFIKHFMCILWAIKGIVLLLSLALLGIAYGLAYVEQLAFVDGLYLTLITALTIGYGDTVPVTPCGKLLAVSAGFIGVIFMGLNVATATLAVKQSIPKKYRNITKTD